MLLAGQEARGRKRSAKAMLEAYAGRTNGKLVRQWFTYDDGNARVFGWGITWGTSWVGEGRYYLGATLSDALAGMWRRMDADLQKERDRIDEFSV